MNTENMLCFIHNLKETQTNEDQIFSNQTLMLNLFSLPQFLTSFKTVKISWIVVTTKEYNMSSLLFSLPYQPVDYRQLNQRGQA